MTALQFERFYPYVGALLVAAAWYVLGCAFPKDPTNLLVATGTTSAVLVGFVATVMAIILSITGSAVFRTLRAAGYHKDLFNYLFEAIVWGMLFLVFSMVGYFVTTPEVTPWLFKALWVLLAGLNLFVFLRAFLIVFKLLKQA